MNRFNAYMNSHFKGLKLLAQYRDELRGRDVRIYEIPDYPDDVGFTDGVESWVGWRLDYLKVIEKHSNAVQEVPRRVALRRPVVDAPVQRRKINV